MRIQNLFPVIANYNIIFHIVEKLADKISGGSHYSYVQIMNSPLTANNLPFIGIANSLDLLTILFLIKPKTLPLGLITPHPHLPLVSLILIPTLNTNPTPIMSPSLHHLLAIRLNLKHLDH